MPVALKVPQVGESITEVEIGEWLIAEGAGAERDQVVVMLDTEKTTVELPAPVSGVITTILKQVGESAKVGEIIAYMEEGQAAPQAVASSTASAADTAAALAPSPTPQAAPEQPGEPKPEWEKPSQPPQPTPQKIEPVPTAQIEMENLEAEKQTPPAELPTAEAPRTAPAPRIMPAAERVLAQTGARAEEVAASGPGGRLLKEDVQRHVEGTAGEPAPAAEINQTAPVEIQAPTPQVQAAPPQTQVAPQPAPAPSAPPPAVLAGPQSGEEEVVRMTLLRRKVAEHLVHAQQQAALLTTFNEIDMSAIMALRKEHQESFQKRYNTKLGFMSFFVKASIDALKQIPGVNAQIRGDDIVYHNYYDIGVAIGGGKGLVVPVLRRAERLSFAEIEIAIGDFAKRAKDNKLKPEELMGGTFTITNGGIYGSLLSTPIVNAPQSGILGMHAIQERPVARDGQVVIRPMMYVALTYDHRLVDGREAVTFLVRLKECIENPARMLIEV